MGRHAVFVTTILTIVGTLIPHFIRRTLAARRGALRSPEAHTLNPLVAFDARAPPLARLPVEKASPFITAIPAGYATSILNFVYVAGYVVVATTHRPRNATVVDPHLALLTEAARLASCGAGLTLRVALLVTGAAAIKLPLVKRTIIFAAHLIVYALAVDADEASLTKASTRTAAAAPRP